MYLEQGDLVAIVSPSRAISEEEVRPAAEWLERVGFRVHLGKHLYGRFNQFAGNDEQRLADLQDAVDNPEVKAVWSSRGGYGAGRIVDRLDLSVWNKGHKWMVGYSDFTVFHTHLNRRGIPSIHATMPVNMIQEDGPARDSLLRALVGEDLTHSLPVDPLNRPGEASGTLVGGNLSILYSMMGSKSQLDTEGKILFLEDLDEYLYHVDRMMVNLKRGGMLHGLKALVVGSLSEMNDNTIPYGRTAEEIVREHVDEFDYPVYFGLSSGHVPGNLALRFGMQAYVSEDGLFLPS